MKTISKIIRIVIVFNITLISEKYYVFHHGDVSLDDLLDYILNNSPTKPAGVG